MFSPPTVLPELGELSLELIIRAEQCGLLVESLLAPWDAHGLGRLLLLSRGLRSCGGCYGSCSSCGGRAVTLLSHWALLLVVSILTPAVLACVVVTVVGDLFDSKMTTPEVLTLGFSFSSFSALPLQWTSLLHTDMSVLHMKLGPRRTKLSTCASLGHLSFELDALRCAILKH